MKWVHLVGLAGALGVFEDQDAVADRAGRRALGVVLPGGNPQPALGVPGHLHGLDQFGELLLAGEQIHLAVLGRRFIFVMASSPLRNGQDSSGFGPGWLVGTFSTGGRL